MVQQRDASVAIVAAGDFIGAAIARKFAAEGFVVHVGRRNGDKLQPLLDDIAAAGGRAYGRTLGACIPEDVTPFLPKPRPSHRWR